jgi:hypothetical protein
MTDPMTANIVALTVLSDDTDDRVFSVLSDWTDDTGLNWPEDSAIKTRLEAELGRKVESVEFTDAGDFYDHAEGIYTWKEEKTR